MVTLAEKVTRGGNIMPGDKKIDRRAFLTRSARFSIGVAVVAALRLP